MLSAKRILIHGALCLVLGIALIGAAHAGDNGYESGRTLYLNKCQICHGTHGDGKGPAGVSLTPKPRDFTKPSFWDGETAEIITNAVKNGAGPMPAFKFNPEETKDLINYLSRAFKKP